MSTFGGRATKIPYNVKKLHSILFVAESDENTFQSWKIAIFFGNILREERNSVFPHFSPKKSVFSGHEWLQFECRAKRDILNRSHEWPEYTDFAGGKVGENFSLRLQYEQRRLFSLVLQTFWVLFWAVRTAMKVPGKVFKVGGKVIKLEGKVLFPLPWRLFQAPS